MPTNFRLPMSTQLRLEISGQTAAVASKRNSGEWLSYSNFVDKLAKPLNTPGEELHHMTTGMSGEAGELLDISKKVWIYTKPINVIHLIEELGDLRWYYQGALNMLGLTDEDIQAANTIKLMKRYPEGVYSDSAAIARADKAPGEDKERHVSPRKFMGMPPKEPPTRHPSTYVSSSESKPLPDAVYDKHCSMTPTQQTALRAEMQQQTEKHLAALEERLKGLGEQDETSHEKAGVFRNGDPK